MKSLNDDFIPVNVCLFCKNKHIQVLTHRSDGMPLLKCENCGTIMVAKIYKNPEKIYNADYFENQKPKKIGYSRYFSLPAANLIGKYGFARLFAKEPGEHIDLGCADGSLMEIFVAAGFSSRGFDISNEAVAVAKAKKLQADTTRLEKFSEGLPKSNVVTAFDLLEHSDQPGVVLKEVYRNLKDDGYFVFSTLSVTKENPTEYWFNNSLEHYVYFTSDSLSYALTQVFGKNNFAFAEIEVNGIAEFWGFAKKGVVKDEQKIISNIAKGDFDENSASDAYLTSLFYDQLSMFQESSKIINFFGSKWDTALLLQARFYNYYFQGKFEKALAELDDRQHLIGANDSIFWQAVSFVKTQFWNIREKHIVTEYNEEIINLRERLFKARDQLQSLKNSRVLGKIIKTRDRIGLTINNAGGARKIPVYAVKKTIHKARTTVAPMFPEETRTKLKSTYRKAKTKASVVKKRPKHIAVEVTEVTNDHLQLAHQLISVVIPYYNRADTIDETIQSLQQQTFKDFEIIIVNDGSPQQESVDKLHELDLTGLRAEVTHQENQGVAAARNNGISKAKGKYIICLDSDDILEPTFIEKVLCVLETQPDVSLITTNVKIFGVINEPHINKPYDPIKLLSDNMVITAAAFRKEAWLKSGGYKSGIGYEDWEFWLSLAENGYWGKLIEEELFVYRTSLQSRYVEDKDIHWNNIKAIKSLHPAFKKNVKKLLATRSGKKMITSPDTAFINLASSDQYKVENGKPNVLITMPWMTFGGAETLVYNYCREIKEDVNITFMTGLHSKNEWEYKFKSITPAVYHLRNLFEDPRLDLEFISNYIVTRKVTILHIVHNGFIFDMLPELKKRHPELKVIVTLFNDRVPEYVNGVVKYGSFIDELVSDNDKVKTSLAKQMKNSVKTTVIPNGIDAFDEFNPAIFSRASERSELNIAENDMAVFFVGRLSEEKNPDVFINTAKQLAQKKSPKKIKFFIIGDGPMRTAVEKSIRDAHEADITYLGYQASPARFLSAADVFVLPSSIEGFPLSVLEAMAMEVAVVASDVGAVAEVVSTGIDGFVVKPGSAEEIVETIAQLTKNDSLLKSVKNKARASVVKKYSNRILGANYRKLYRS